MWTRLPSMNRGQPKRAAAIHFSHNPTPGQQSHAGLRSHDSVARREGTVGGRRNFARNFGRMDSGAARGLTGRNAFFRHAGHSTANFREQTSRRFQGGPVQEFLDLDWLRNDNIYDDLYVLYYENI